MKKFATLLVIGALLSGCTSTLQPIGQAPNYSAFTRAGQLTGCGWPEGMSLQELVSPEVSGNRYKLVLNGTEDKKLGAGQMQPVPKPPKPVSRLDWLSCEMLAKSMSNFSQAGQLRNRNEWRDIPLIGSAITAAALVLFGNRSMDGNLTSGSTDVIEGLALATGGFVLLSNYLDPDEAADLLYKSALGHRCLAEHGQTVAAYGNLAIGDTAVTDAKTLRKDIDSLKTMAMELNTRRAKGRDQQANALAAVERGERALAFYEKQRTAREIAPARLYLASYDFSIKLSQAARRESVQIDNLQTTLSASIRAQSEQAGIVNAEGEGSQPEKQQQQESVEAMTDAINSKAAAFATRMPNLTSLVAQFDACTALAFLGQPLPRPQITFTGSQN